MLDATFIVVPEAGAAGPVGTAVALDDGTFVTAAHVLNGIMGGRYTQPFLYRAPARYAIQEIVRYSQTEDFVVFGVRPVPNTNLLPPTTLPANETLPAAGERLYLAAHTSDAQQELRDGLTLGAAVVEPLTPREESAHRSWFAFRAHTTHGMSGGALIDASGAVVGILVEQDAEAAANQAGTRNRATNMKAVLARDVANADIWPQRALYSFGLYDYSDVLGSTEPTIFAPGFFNAEDIGSTPIPLGRPMAYADFVAQVAGIRARYFERAFEPWLRSGGVKVLAATSAAAACELLNAQSCGHATAGAHDAVLNAEDPRPITWRGSNPTSFSTRLDGALVLRRQTTTPVTLDTLFPADASASSAIGIALSCDPRWRDRFTTADLEAPDPDQSYLDIHGHEWRLRSIALRGYDLKLVALARPVADGYVALFRVVPTSLVHAATLHMKTLASIDTVAQ